MKMEVTIAGKTFKNPVTTASGTFGSGAEYEDFVDLSKLGAVTTKGVANVAWAGNDTPRIAETTSGMLNAVGLQNPGIDLFCKRDIPHLVEKKADIIVNVCGRTIEDYVEVVERLADQPVSLLEINVSCPNVKAGCMSIGSDSSQVKEIVSILRSMTKLPLWIKLTPNVTDIKSVALAAQEGGADAVVLINTLLGMKIDIRTRRPVLHNNTGGYSGPAVKPVAIRMVSECNSVLDIPIVGCGGIMSAEDVIEFMIAGSSAVEIGTGSLVHPTLPVKITEDLEKYCEDNQLELSSLTGTLQLW